MGSWLEEIPGEVSASGGKVYVVREDASPERFSEYNIFAHNFYDNSVSLKDPYEFANTVRSRWLMTQEFREELPLLKACLLVEVRRGRFIWGYPGPDDMEYMDALYAHIKSLMA